MCSTGYHKAMILLPCTTLGETKTCVESNTFGLHYAINVKITRALYECCYTYILGKYWYYLQVTCRQLLRGYVTSSQEPITDSGTQTAKQIPL